MKITVSKLRQIIREEVEKNLIESKLKVGDKVSAKDGSGWWEVLELIPDNKTGKTAAKLKMYTPSGGKTAIAYRNTNELSKVRESMDFSDYIRDVDRDMPKPGEPPDPQDVHDEFLMWRDDKGEVPLEKLASELGVEPKEINWNGTGLRVINGIVTELL